MKIKMLFALATVFIFSLTACGMIPTPTPTPEASAPTPAVEDNTVSASGVVEPAKWQNLGFASGGQKLELDVNIGDKVTQADLIAAVDPRSAEVAIDTAKAQLANAQATLARLDDIEKTPEADLEAAKAAVTAAESALAEANRAWAQTSLSAPFDGSVIDVYARTGDYVAPGTPLILIADLTTLQVKTTDLSEVDAARVSVGDAVQVSFDALPDTTVAGEVTQIALKNSPGSGVYYTVTIKLDTIPENLRWGMSAFVVITIK